jgi:hypothetical protein
MIVADDTVRLDKAVAAPTAPVNVVVPAPAVIVKALAPLIMSLKEILAPFELIVLLPANVTELGKVKAFAPETVTSPPSEIKAGGKESGAVLKKSPDKAAELPTFPPRIIEPISEFNVSARGTEGDTTWLSIVLNEMSAFPT